MFPTLSVILALAVLYRLPIRRWMARWGTTPSDLTRVMAGDRLIVDPTYSGTMAVIVNARPEHIWPWLVQMGYQRGGLYSYDWLDRLFRFSGSSECHPDTPEFQHLAVGDTIPVGQGRSWPVATIEPRRALVLDMRAPAASIGCGSSASTRSTEKRTLLVSRSRVHARTTLGLAADVCIEPAGFVMTRRMLLGLKQWADRPEISTRRYSRCSGCGRLINGAPSPFPSPGPLNRRRSCKV